MINLLKIAQISDIHISGLGDFYQDINVKEQFHKTLTAACQSEPDLIILSGDLAAEDGEDNAYKWVKKQIEAIDIPCLFMAGNHDSAQRIADIFDISELLQNSMLYYKWQIKGHSLLFLDSSSGIITRNQLQWLIRETKKSPSRETLLFMHHPPINCQCRFMDATFPLQNRSEVWQVLLSIPNLRYIFCGHYHTEKTLTHKDRFIFLTPSTMAQIQQEKLTFQVEHTHPGWRTIEWDGEKLMTWVRYLCD